MADSAARKNPPDGRGVSVRRELLPSMAALEATSEGEAYLAYGYRQLFMLVFSHRSRLGKAIDTENVFCYNLFRKRFLCVGSIEA
jgi:hypothetical protein